MVDPVDMKTAISTIREPHVLKNFKLDWPLFRMTFEEWSQKMDETTQKSVQFTCGTDKHCDLPYWERFREKISLKFSEFLSKAKDDKLNNCWLSHSYKDISSWPRDLQESITFKQLGFDNVQDILFWLGSKGSNTPCHYDSYGFNIVVQVFGSKRWLVFPPNTALTATRIPYEESSIYCKQNFYSPADMEQFDGIGKHNDAYEINLNPGDILIVPPNWWHYVENTDTSLTVNTWIPLEIKDASARLEECFVRMQIEKITEDNDDDDGEQLRKYVFNPNEIDSRNELNLLNLFKPLADIIIENSNQTDPHSTPALCEKGESIRKKHADIFHKVQPISQHRFTEILSTNSLRYDGEFEKRKTDGQQFHEIESIINALCHPKTVKSACELYLEQIQIENS